MPNRWGISKDVGEFVQKRDTHCVYCDIKFNDEEPSFKNRKSWEHIINDIRLNQADNIALCCRSCNASKGSKLLKDWLNSKYCKTKNINENTVAEVVNKQLRLNKN